MRGRRRGAGVSSEASRAAVRRVLLELAPPAWPKWLEFVDVLPGNEPIASPEVSDTDGSVIAETEGLVQTPANPESLVESVLHQADAAHQALLQGDDKGR